MQTMRGATSAPTSEERATGVTEDADPTRERGEERRAIEQLQAQVRALQEEAARASAVIRDAAEIRVQLERDRANARATVVQGNDAARALVEEGEAAREAARATLQSDDAVTQAQREAQTLRQEMERMRNEMRAAFATGFAPRADDERRTAVDPGGSHRPGKEPWAPPPQQLRLAEVIDLSDTESPLSRDLQAAPWPERF